MKTSPLGFGMPTPTIRPGLVNENYAPVRRDGCGTSFWSKINRTFFGMADNNLGLVRSCNEYGDVGHQLLLCTHMFPWEAHLL